MFEQTAGFDRAKGLSVTEAALAGMSDAAAVIVAANDDMALGAIEAVKARNLKGIVIIGFDALPEALGRSATASSPRRSSSSPASRARPRVDILADFLKSGKKPDAADHAADAGRDHQGQSEQAERLSEVK